MSPEMIIVADPTTQIRRGIYYICAFESSPPPQWFKPLVNNGQNLNEFEYRDVVYVYRGFRP